MLKMYFKFDYKILIKSVPHFSQFISVKVKKNFKRISGSIWGKLRKLRPKQNDGFLIKNVYIVDSLISSGGERVSDLTVRSRISAPITFLENNFPPPPPLISVSTFLDEICKKVGAVSELPKK